MSSITTPTSENRPSLKVRTSKTSSAFDDEDDFDIDVDENWSGTIWQYTTLTPFTD